jgi:aminoglycoside 6'-N-acetyltransferase I
VLAVIQIVEAQASDIEVWARMRFALWPDSTEADHRQEAEALLCDASVRVALIARANDGTAVGFAEVSLRHDYVNGCSTSPVGFLEGLFVVESARREGVARRLCDAGEAWAAARGCTEFASDVPVDNRLSQDVHRALGFEETERVVFFRKAVS